MALIYEPSAAQEEMWKEWVAERPDNVRAVAERFVPWRLYRLGSEGHRVVIRSFQESDDGGVTMTVAVTGKHNFLIFEREVFGINPDELIECDLPERDEAIGVLIP